jgi:hypothetical protein
VIVAADDFRDYVPEFQIMQVNGDRRGAQITDREAGEMVKEALRRAREAKMNIIFDGLMRVPKTVEESVTLFCEKGYKAKAVMLTVDLYEALLRTEGASTARAGPCRPTSPSAPGSSRNRGRGSCRTGTRWSIFVVICTSFTLGLTSGHHVVDAADGEKAAVHDTVLVVEHGEFQALEVGAAHGLGEHGEVGPGH